MSERPRFSVARRCSTRPCVCARGLQRAGSRIGLLSAPCLRAFFVAHLRSESRWIVFCLQKFGSCSRCRTGRSTWATSAPFSCWITTTMAASRCRCAARDTPAPCPHAYALPFRPPGTWTLMIACACACAAGIAGLCYHLLCQGRRIPPPRISDDDSRLLHAANVRHDGRSGKRVLCALVCSFIFGERSRNGL